MNVLWSIAAASAVMIVVVVVVVVVVIGSTDGTKLSWSCCFVTDAHF